jgi:hypothetical protein
MTLKLILLIEQEKTMDYAEKQCLELSPTGTPLEKYCEICGGILPEYMHPEYNKNTN